MHDSTKKQAAMIGHLESALGLADELNDSLTGYLIERALDEARSHMSAASVDSIPAHRQNLSNSLPATVEFAANIAVVPPAIGTLFFLRFQFGGVG